MCEIYAMSSLDSFNVKSDLNKMALHTDVHKDGWGIALYEKDQSGKALKTYKESEKMIDSLLFNFLVNNNMIESDIVLNHIRTAVAKKGIANNHPFTCHLFGKQWSFIYNGAYGASDNYRQYYTNNEEFFIPAGTSGAERLFSVMMNELKENMGSYSFGKAQKIMYNTALDYFGDNNFILSDGEYVIAYFGGFSELNYVEEKNISFISSKPLDDTRDWYKFDNQEMRIYRKGQLISINGEFINNLVNEEDYIYIDNVFDSSITLDEKRNDKKVIGMSKNLMNKYDIKTGDKITISNKSIDIDLIAFAADKRLEKNGVCCAESNDFVCLPRKIRNLLSLRRYQPNDRANLNAFRAKFSGIYIKIKEGELTWWNMEYG